MNNKSITIHYCAPWNFKPKALQVAAELETALSGQINSIDILEAQRVGTFDVFLDDVLVYSKSKTGRVPHPGEIEQIVIARIG